jgi:hypothetical protein
LFVVQFQGAFSDNVYRTLAMFLIVNMTLPYYNDASRPLRMAVVGALFALPFIGGELVGIGLLVAIAGVAFAIAVVALIATNVLFQRLMKAPTLTGRKLLDQIDGLRLYVGVAERDDLARQQVPPLTTEEFHRLLPYALALGVERTWTDRFAATVGPAAAAAA